MHNLTHILDAVWHCTKIENYTINRTKIQDLFFCFSLLGQNNSYCRIRTHKLIFQDTVHFIYILFYSTNLLSRYQNVTYTFSWNCIIFKSSCKRNDSKWCTVKNPFQHSSHDNICISVFFVNLCSRMSAFQTCNFQIKFLSFLQSSLYRNI